MKNEDIESINDNINKAMGDDFTPREINIIRAIIFPLLTAYEETQKRTFANGFWLGAGTASLLWWYFS